MIFIFPEYMEPLKEEESASIYSVYSIFKAAVAFWKTTVFWGQYVSFCDKCKLHTYIHESKNPFNCVQLLDPMEYRVHGISEARMASLLSG